MAAAGPRSGGELDEPTLVGDDDQRPILLVPYIWIGDFVRCHTVTRLLKSRWPARPIDVLASTACAPLTDYMPGVRKAIVWDIPRGRLAFGEHRRLARRLESERYGTAIVLSRKWKAALAPFLAGIPERVGFVGEARFGLINDLRHGEKKLPRMIDRCAALALPRDATASNVLPPPQLVVPPEEIERWRRRANAQRTCRLTIAICPGAAGAGKRWPEENYAELARQLHADGMSVWVVGGPDEMTAARAISQSGEVATDRTGADLREAIMALAAADVVIANDSGLLHVAAALGTPTVGLFGPTDPRLWAPLNPLAATIEAPYPTTAVDRQHCQMIDIRVDEVLGKVRAVISELRAGTAFGNGAETRPLPAA